jgi:hypothetical protein
MSKDFDGPQNNFGIPRGGIASSLHCSGYEQYPFNSIGQNNLAQGIYGSPSASYYNIIRYLQVKNYNCFVHYLDFETSILATSNCD